MATWDNTQEGQNLRDAWTSLQKMYRDWLPAHRTSLQNLANRPIGG